MYLIEKIKSFIRKIKECKNRLLEINSYQDKLQETAYNYQDKLIELLYDENNYTSVKSYGKNIDSFRELKKEYRTIIGFRLCI